MTHTANRIATFLALSLLASTGAPAQETYVLQEDQEVMIIPGSQEILVVPNHWQIINPTGDCSSTTVPPLSEEEIASLPEVVRFAEDAGGDFLLDHPLFEENFGVVYESNEMIPPELDITTVEVGSDGENYRFHIRTAGGDLGGLLQEMPRTAQLAVYVDVDRNGLSDYLLTTTGEPGQAIVTDQDFGGIVQEAGVVAEGDSLTLSISSELVGHNFDWLAVTRYSPEPRAFHTTPLENVFFTPAVDVVYAADPPRIMEFFTNYSGTGQKCKVTNSGYSTCPARGAPQVTAPGGESGAMIFQKQCGTRGLGLWCLGSYFGKRVFDGSREGWVAKCPFLCGFNQQSHWDTDGDNAPDKVFHSVTDADCRGSASRCRLPSPMATDKDCDHRRDTMRHTYWYASDKVISCNVEREASGALYDNKCLNPRPPYGTAARVPGAIEEDPPKSGKYKGDTDPP